MFIGVTPKCRVWLMQKTIYKNARCTSTHKTASFNQASIPSQDNVVVTVKINQCCQVEGKKDLAKFQSHCFVLFFFYTQPQSRVGGSPSCQCWRTKRREEGSQGTETMDKSRLSALVFKFNRWNLHRTLNSNQFISNEFNIWIQLIADT